MNRPALTVVLAAAALAGCASTPAPYYYHYPDVRPSADGTHRTVLTVERLDGHFQYAFRQARDFCSDVHEQRPTVVSEGARYVGTMDETTYTTIKTATAVAVAAGSAVEVFASSWRARNAGLGTAVAGSIGNQALPPGYEYTLAFRCG